MKRIVAHFTLSLPLEAVLKDGYTEEQAIEELRNGAEELKEDAPDGTVFTFRAEVVDE